MKRILIVLTGLVLLPMNIALAQHEDMDMSGMNMGNMTSKSATSEGVGVVEGVDKSNGTVTLSHEPIASLNWPAMTMDFAVEDKKLFNKLTAGKKVKFQFIKHGNQYLVTSVK